MDRIVSPGRIAAAAFASVTLAVCAARAAVVIPPLHHLELQAVADRVHALAVQVRARAFVTEHTDAGLRVHEVVSSASGVLIGNGLALTGLGSVALRGQDGGVLPASEIEVVVDDVGPLPARLVAGDTGLDLAILQLPEGAKGLTGASIAAEDPNVGEALLAVGVEGDSIRALGVRLESVSAADDGDPRLQMDRALPAPLSGGPLFDGRGHLAGITTQSAGAGGAAVPASLLRALLRKVLGGTGI